LQRERVFERDAAAALLERYLPIRIGEERDA
jgi:hypothetical protein